MSLKNFMSYEDASTVLGEYAGEINQLKSGLTNVADDVKLNTQDLTTPSRTKNLLPLTVAGIKARNTDGTWDGDTYTENGVTFTIQKDSDGKVTEITANGTASYETYFNLADNDKLKVLAEKNIVLNGSIGGSTGTYLIQAVAYNGVNSVASRDGDSVAFTPTSAFSQVRIIIIGGATVDNVNFYPMLRLASITDNTFAPYIPSVESRIEAVESGLIKHYILTKASFNWDSAEKCFITGINFDTTIPNYHNLVGIVVNAANGMSIMGAYYNSTSHILRIAGWVPSSGVTIDDAYDFTCCVFYT